MSTFHTTTPRTDAALAQVAKARETESDYKCHDALIISHVSLEIDYNGLRELLSDIEKHLSGGAALHPGSLIFAEDAPAVDVIRAALETAVNSERERIIGILSRTEFTSLDHMPHEAATIIRAREVIP